MAPYTLVRLARFGRSADLKRILFATRFSAKSWLAAVEDDYNWLRHVSGDFHHYQQPSHWFKAFRGSPNVMRKTSNVRA